MIGKLVKSEIAQDELSKSAAKPLHFDSCSSKYIKSGSKCNFRRLGGLISCGEDTHPLRSL